MLVLRLKQYIPVLDLLFVKFSKPLSDYWGRGWGYVWPRGKETYGKRFRGAVGVWELPSKGINREEAGEFVGREESLEKQLGIEEDTQRTH